MSVLYRQEGPVAYITINRPEAMNSFDIATADELDQAFQNFNQDDGLLVAILTGAGEKAFCSGADLKSYIPQLTSGKPHPVSGSRYFSNIYKPIVAAINGYCLAGGFEMMLGTDIRIAAEHARFGLPEPRWGIIPSCGSHVRLPRQIGWARAMEILLTGDQFTAQQALDMGLINRVVPLAELMPAAEEIARRICKNGPLAVRTIKEIAVRATTLPLHEAFVVESLLAGRVYASEDAREGPQAFAEKRPPMFKGR